MKTRSVLDLFAGAGGFSWGFDKFQLGNVGFKVVLSVELERSHVATYKKNHPQTIAICADVQRIPGKWFVEQMGRPFIVIGGPPCQSFSIQGKRNPNDPRLKLIFEFERIVRETESPYFLMENVEGLTLREMRPVFDELCDRFTDDGYQIAWKIINAADYGIPQRRKRVFLMGARLGLPLPEFPEPLKERVTVIDALADLPVVENYPQLMFQRTGIDWLPFSCMPSEPISHYAALLRELPPPRITGLARTQHCLQTVGSYLALEPGCKDRKTHSTKLEPHNVAPTLLAGSLSRSHTALRHIHYKYPRVLLPREGARLQSFPDYFEFDSRISIAWNQIGNAVPPLLSRRFAEKFAHVAESELV